MSMDRLIISSRCGNEKNKHSNSSDLVVKKPRIELIVYTVAIRRLTI